MTNTEATDPQVNTYGRPVKADMGELLRAIGVNSDHVVNDSVRIRFAQGGHTAHLILEFDGFVVLTPERWAALQPLIEDPATDCVVRDRADMEMRKTIH